MHTNIVFRQKLWITWSALILSVLLFLLLCQMQLKASNLHRGIFLSCKLPSSSGARRKATSPQLLCSRIKHWTFRLPTCTLARQLSMTIAKEGQNVLLEVFFLKCVSRNKMYFSNDYCSKTLQSTFMTRVRHFK